jgi:hypothetical protein
MFPFKWVPLEAGSHKSASPRAFLTDGEHMSMGTSMYVKNLFFFFPPFFPCLVFLNFPDLSHQKIFLCEHGNIEKYWDLPHRITP